MMMYNDQLSPAIDWAPPIDYPNRRPRRRSKAVICFVLGTIVLALSAAALIIVFAVEHSWFSDSFNQTNVTSLRINVTSNGMPTNQYGLWRLCFYGNQSCESWFQNEGPSSLYIDQRLNQAKIGINAWQALEIVFLFLIGSTLIIAVVALISFPLWPHVYYYLAILTAFCIVPAVCVGISGLFVFGFSVFNVATQPRSLDWCFYVNIAAVALALIASIFFIIHDILLKRPKRPMPEEAVLGSFPDFYGYPATSAPSTFVVVNQKNKKREKPSKASRPANPYEYFPSAAAPRNARSADYLVNPNQPMMVPYSSGIGYQPRNASVDQQSLMTTPYRTPEPSYPGASMPRMGPAPLMQSPPYQMYTLPTEWQRRDANINDPRLTNNTEAVNDYVRRGIYRPARLEPIQHGNDQRPMFNYQTNSNGFSALDPSEITLPRNHSGMMGPGSPMGYSVNPSYRQ